MPRKKPIDDNPEWTEEDFRNATPAYKMPKEMLKFFPNTKRRGPQKTPKKVAISIRLSPEVVEHFKEGGPGWQKRIDEALKKLVNA